jgi:hypothetical protein
VQALHATPGIRPYLVALRGLRGNHSEAARNVLLTILLAQLLAGAGHEGPPHRSWGAPRHTRVPRSKLPRRGSVSGRRARG